MNYSTCPQQCDGLTMNCSLTTIESSLCTLEEPFQDVKGGSLDLIYSYHVMGDANRMSKCEKNNGNKAIGRQLGSSPASIRPES